MSLGIALARIDDRFIHGQVTVGWTQKLGPGLILLANSEIAGDPWQSRVYRSSVAPEIRVAILGMGQAVEALPGLAAADGPRTIVLAGSPQDMHYLHRHSRLLREVNVGGMHYAEGKREVLPFLWADRWDLRVFRSFLDDGVRLWAQEVPGSAVTEIDGELLDRLEADR